MNLKNLINNYISLRKITFILGNLYLLSAEINKNVFKCQPDEEVMTKI